LSAVALLIAIASQRAGSWLRASKKTPIGKQLPMLQHAPRDKAHALTAAAGHDSVARVGGDHMER
jgi:hypothetical protein